MAPAAPPDATAPRGLRIRTGKALAPLKVEPGVCGGAGSLTTGDRPRWKTRRGTPKDSGAGHRPPLGLDGYPTAPKKGNPTLSYANLATGRSPGFGSMVGSPEGGRRRWRPTPLPPLRLVAPKLVAWTAAAGRNYTTDGGRRSSPAGELRRSRTISRRPIMQKVRLDTPFGGRQTALGRSHFNGFSFRECPGCLVSPFPHGTCALSVSSSIFRAGGWDPLLSFAPRCLAGVLLTYGSGRPRFPDRPSPKGLERPLLPAESGFGPTLSSHGGFYPLWPEGNPLRRGGSKYSLSGSFQNIGGVVGGGLR